MLDSTSSRRSPGTAVRTRQRRGPSGPCRPPGRQPEAIEAAASPATSCRSRWACWRPGGRVELAMAPMDDQNVVPAPTDRATIARPMNPVPPDRDPHGLASATVCDGSAGSGWHGGQSQVPRCATTRRTIGRPQPGAGRQPGPTVHLEEVLVGAWLARRHRHNPRTTYRAVRSPRPAPAGSPRAAGRARAASASPRALGVEAGLPQDLVGVQVAESRPGNPDRAAAPSAGHAADPAGGRSRGARSPAAPGQGARPGRRPARRGRGTGRSGRTCAGPRSRAASRRRRSRSGGCAATAARRAVRSTRFPLILRWSTRNASPDSPTITYLPRRVDRSIVRPTAVACRACRAWRSAPCAASPASRPPTIGRPEDALAQAPRGRLDLG